MREHLGRLVLIVGALTMLATSAPQSFEINNGTTVNRDTRVRVRFSADAVGDSMSVVFSWDGTEAATVTPDPAVPQAAYMVAPGANVTYDVASVCEGPCEFIFTIDAPESAGTMYVEAISGREGDPSFCFPDNREFSADATIEVAVVP